MTIATENDVISARANKRQGMNFQKASIANMVAGALCSMYRSTGPVPSQPAIPGAAALCTKALTWNFNNPTAPDKTYLDVMDGVCSNAGRIVWFDRLFHIGGLSGTVTTAQAAAAAQLDTMIVLGADVTAHATATASLTAQSQLAWRGLRAVRVPLPRRRRSAAPGFRLGAMNL